MINSGMFGLGGAPNDISQASATANAASAARSAQDTARLLSDRLERLSLVCMAMWSLIQDKTGLTEEDLLERVKAIDLMDGAADGKATRTVSKCAKCGRVMSPRHQRCIYCGAQKLVQSAFDAV